MIWQAPNHDNIRQKKYSKADKLPLKADAHI